MSEANKNSHVEPLQIANIVGLANDRLEIERAYLLIDNYIAEMAERETKAALAGIKTAIRARAAQPAFAKRQF